MSSLPKIRANIRLLDEVLSDTTKELDSIYKQIAEEEIMEGDVKKLLEEATLIVDSTCETTTGL